MTEDLTISLSSGHTESVTRTERNLEDDGSGPSYRRENWLENIFARFEGLAVMDFVLREQSSAIRVPISALWEVRASFSSDSAQLLTFRVEPDSAAVGVRSSAISMSRSLGGPKVLRNKTRPCRRELQCNGLTKPPITRYDM